MWEILQSREFGKWFLTLKAAEQDKIVMAVKIQEEIGPTLSRPWSDTLKGSKIPNLKELRVRASGAIFRILYFFDTQRRAVLLIGGDKRNNKRFYKIYIPLAEKIYDNYLRESKDEK